MTLFLRTQLSFNQVGADGVDRVGVLGDYEVVDGFPRYAYYTNNLQMNEATKLYWSQNLKNAQLQKLVCTSLYSVVLSTPLKVY